MMKSTLCCYMMLFLCASAVAYQQPEPEQVLKDSDQTIDVSNTVQDQAIAQRLHNILTSSGQFKDIEIRVEEGIVFLSGESQSPEYKTWAEKLAQRTEGVIAVINQITVSADNAWDLQPAVDETVSLYHDFVRTIPKIMIALAILLITWLFAKLTFAMASRVLSQRIKNPFVMRLMARSMALPVVIIGLYLVLQVTGLTKLALTLLGGTGLMGIIIGLAFRDIAENFLASILISIQRPFKINDYIKVDNTEGVVQSVTTRGTVIMTLDGNHIHIPNATIYKNTIINVTANPKIREQFTVGIGYDDGIAKAQQIAVDTISAHPAVLDDPPAQVLVDNLGAATVNLVVYFWVDGVKNSTSKVKSAVIRLVKRAYDEAGISMPDEAREVVFPEGIRVWTEDNSGQAGASKTPDEPLNNEAEDNLSNQEMANIQQQAEQHQLSEQGQNLIQDDL
ncbi:MAG: BON domain-containing protein [Proteobacteria bacterium]|nr:MAG: BON domain-containing protein [Pseudomonadota bacterium]